MPTNKTIPNNLNVASCMLLIDLTFKSQITPIHELVMDMEHILDKERDELTRKIEALNKKLEMIEYYRSRVRGIN